MFELSIKLLNCNHGKKICDFINYFKYVSKKPSVEKI